MYIPVVPGGAKGAGGAVGSGGAGGAVASHFGRSVNPISSRKVRLCPPLAPSDFQTILWPFTVLYGNTGC